MSSREIMTAQGFEQKEYKFKNKIMSEIYKKVKMNVSQLAISICALDDVIKKEEEYKKFYKEKLNASESTEDVKHYQTRVKETRLKIIELNSLIESMKTGEFTTEHKLR
tara:strand:- start:16482 stop:16808 length:327 start_codon:yes stop_codon:yes gene_type:complete